MVAAVSLLEHNALESRPAPLSRGEVLARYRRLREISKHHHNEALNHIRGRDPAPRAPIGLGAGKTLILDDMEELNYAFDLAIHTASADRSRAIDRYARSARLVPGSDEMLVLDAMRAARFRFLASNGGMKLPD